MLRKDLLDKIGYFDEDFFLYHEESELCNRILKNNFEIYSVPDAKIIHLEGKSGFKDEKFRLYMKHYYIFFAKVGGKKIVKEAYFYLQLKHLLILNMKRYKINKEEYQKFLQNYKNLRKDY